MSTPNEYPYRAFISYSHHDAGWARWLHRALETYTVPKRLIGGATTRGVIGKRLGAVFRDREELSSEADLDAAVTRSLAESQFLIVICSPDSARSKWVNQEVLAFKRLGREDAILTLVVAGEPASADLSRNCFCDALRFRLDHTGKLSETPIEPLSADARGQSDGRRLALLKIISGLLGVKLDELQQRDAQRRHRKMMVISLASFAGMLLTLSLAIVAQFARNDADRRRDHAEQLLSFMVGDLRESLEPIGRLDLLEQVGNQAMSYFAGVEPSDLTDEGLAKHSKTLTQIGNIRLSQRRYEDALKAFTEAYGRSAALAERSPLNTDFLFERGQAEFWVGYVHWRHGQLDQAQTWLRAYRDSGVALLKTDPNREDWQFEVISGHHNLAVISLEGNDLREAESGFREERDMLLALVDDEGFDSTLTDQLAIVESWLGTTLQRRGRLADSSTHFQQSAAYREAVANADPDNAIERYRWAMAKLFVAYNHSIVGNLDNAGSGLLEVVETLRVLTDADPENREWQRTYAQALMRLAAVQVATLRPAALETARRAVELSGVVVDEQARDREGARIAALAQLQLALILQSRGDTSIASAHADAALRLLQPHRELARTDFRVAGALGQALATCASFAGGSDDTALARDYLEDAKDVLSVHAETSAYDLVLDPWVRVLHALGEREAAAAAQSTLSDGGYRPLVPWPEA